MLELKGVKAYWDEAGVGGVLSLNGKATLGEKVNFAFDIEAKGKLLDANAKAMMPLSLQKVVAGCWV